MGWMHFKVWSLPKCNFFCTGNLKSLDISFRCNKKAMLSLFSFFLLYLIAVLYKKGIQHCAEKGH